MQVVGAFASVDTNHDGAILYLRETRPSDAGKARQGMTDSIPVPSVETRDVSLV
jgi:hypothetical protein